MSLALEIRRTSIRERCWIDDYLFYCDCSYRNRKDRRRFRKLQRKLKKELENKGVKNPGDFELMGLLREKVKLHKEEVRRSKTFE